jgi:hypothetical protein
MPTTPAHGTDRDYVIVAKGKYQPVTDASAAAPREYSLFANYPNPFNAGTTIGFNLQDPGHVRIEIFNILGRVWQYWQIGNSKQAHTI